MDKENTMTDMAELAVRIQILEDIEAIRQLKAKYWRCVDKKLWEEREEVYAETIELKRSLVRSRFLQFCIPASPPRIFT